MIPAVTARIDHPDVISQNIRVNGIGHLALAVHSAVATGIHEALDTADEASAGASGAFSKLPKPRNCRTSIEHPAKDARTVSRKTAKCPLP